MNVSDVKVTTVPVRVEQIGKNIVIGQIGRFIVGVKNTSGGVDSSRLHLNDKELRAVASWIHFFHGWQMDDKQHVLNTPHIQITLQTTDKPDLKKVFEDFYKEMLANANGQGIDVEEEAVGESEESQRTWVSDSDVPERGLAEKITLSLCDKVNQNVLWNTSEEIEQFLLSVCNNSTSETLPDPSQLSMSGERYILNERLIFRAKSAPSSDGCPISEPLPIDDVLKTMEKALVGAEERIKDWYSQEPVDIPAIINICRYLNECKRKISAISPLKVLSPILKERVQSLIEMEASYRERLPLPVQLKLWRAEAEVHLR